ncbi:hypothetical protein [Nocardia sp. NPDC050175]|uniref:imine reductase family protein n=1 Tax=Nocardia sp. NPDC050175 TaxID=3364317 RepID=UPI0037B33C35
MRPGRKRKLYRTTSSIPDNVAGTTDTERRTAPPPFRERRGSRANAWFQGTAMLRTAGVDTATYAPFAKQMAAGVAEWLPGHAEQIDSGSFPAEVAALETHAMSMVHLIEESERLGVNAELPRLFKAMADRSIAAGHGGEQYPVLIEEFSKTA